MGKPVCVVCDSASTKYWRTVNDYPLWKCKKCELLFAHPLPTDQELDEFYNKNYHSAGAGYAGFGYQDYEERNYNWTPARVAYYEKFEKKLLQYVTKEAKLLDLGCATGAFLIFLRERGWQKLSGIEYSKDAVTTARKYDLDVLDGKIDDAPYPDECFDVVYSHFVIEHVKDPHSFMKAVHRVLKPGGYFICGTDDFGCLRTKLINFRANFGGAIFNEIKPPEHVLMYSKKTLSTLVERHGFKTLEAVDPRGVTVNDISVNNFFLHAATSLLKPILKNIPFDNEFLVVAKKS